MFNLSGIYKKLIIFTLVIAALSVPNGAFSANKGIDKATSDAYKTENSAEQQELDYIEESTYDSNTAAMDTIRNSLQALATGASAQEVGDDIVDKMSAYE